MKYDFLIVGAGFAGATCARILTDAGYKCIIVEERPFAGGNCVTNNIEGIDVHILGPHIFHTNDLLVWNFVNKYDKFIDYKHKVYTYANGKLYSNSMNLLTLQQVYGFEKAIWPEQYKTVLNDDIEYLSEQPKNLEEYCKLIYGQSIYETLLKKYYEKRFNIPCSELPIQLIEEKNNVNFTYNNDFYNDKYQGIPENGYTLLIEKIIGDDIPIIFNTDYIEHRKKLNELSNYIIYTGQIDKLMNYCIGPLNWVGINIEFYDESETTNNLFGNSVINFADDKLPYYRATEHKFFNNENVNKTLITYESYKEWNIGDIPYFCINDEKSNNKYKQYIDFLKKNYSNLFICGKNAEYKNYSMANTIKSAMNLCNIIINKLNKTVE